MTALEECRTLLHGASRICVLTGAGISAESGIPTFRGAGGMWKNFRPEELATPQAFARDPKLVWEWYNWRREIISGAQPNPGHLALVELESRVPDFTLITQNVDGLHGRAGSRNILEIHGSIWVMRCTACEKSQANHEVPLPDLSPKCPCGGLLRPGVVWFGEGLDAQVWHNAEKAVRSAEVLLVAGTSAVVYPAASLAPLAKNSGARVVEINLDETPISDAVDFSLRGPSGKILPQLIQ
jgi:NAD-dependent deacetylase